MGQDSATFRDNGRDGPGQPVKIREGTRDGTVPDFDSLSLPVPRDKTGQTEKDILKQERMVLNKKMTF